MVPLTVEASDRSWVMVYRCSGGEAHYSRAQQCKPVRGDRARSGPTHSCGGLGG